MRILIGLGVWALLPLGAQAGEGPKSAAVYDTATRLFADMPQLVSVTRIEGNCGADDQVHDRMAYCTSTNSILISADGQASPVAGYEIAHLLGHAVQVRHGVADIALREIRTRPEEEAKLRGWVTRQVACIAGFLYKEAGGAEFEITDFYETEPLTKSYWGRNPLSIGPRVSIGIEARQEWFDIGLEGDLAACAPGEFGSELLIDALIPTQ
ncbi:MAG: hypothetical protein AAF672_12405 [Pseudomonadota bacterium]